MEENTIVGENPQIEDDLEETEVSENEIIEDAEADAQETVSMGDAVTFSVSGEDGSSLTVEDITVAIEAAEIEALVTVSDGNTLWTKPLEEYTVTEGLLLILVLCAVGLVIQKIIGGILNCKFLLKK